MKLTFYGAARAVTGSCHCLDACGKRILVDCGLQQGGDEIDENKLPFHAGEVDYVIATHAHIDHTGRIPLLYKMGYTGQVYTTRLTAQLMHWESFSVTALLMKAFTVSVMGRVSLFISAMLQMTSKRI